MTHICKSLTDLIADEGRVSRSVDDIVVLGLTADSRQVEEGFLFAALKGARSDGTAYIDEAVARGAIAVLCDVEITGEPGVPIIHVTDARRSLAVMAARFFDAQPRIIAAVTGTAGKTSVAAFLRQIWKRAGTLAASIGTVGIVSDVQTVYGSLTTPDPVELHRTIDQLARAGVTHLALEASSHGLDQARLDGVNISIGGFTNLGRDHMDYHETVDDYFSAKMRLVDRLLPGKAVMVVEPDSNFGQDVVRYTTLAGRQPLTVGEIGDGIRLVSLARNGFHQQMTLDFGGEMFDVLLPLAGRFQVSNALIAAGMALASGVEPAVICEALSELKGEEGRLQYVGKNAQGALIFIDYAHKVEALDTVLDTLRPYADHRLIVVFGCGGDRDHGKRLLMGKIAAEKADITVVTDDNPRSENPASVRAMILDGAVDAVEIGDREKAISYAILEAKAGDVIVIAGKGHETGQIVGDQVLPFSDHEVVARLIGGG